MIERFKIQPEPQGQKVDLLPNKSAQTTRQHGEAFKIPFEIAPFLKERPVIREESAEDYDAMLFRIAENVVPDNLIEWMWVKDTAELVWETQRARRARRELLELEFADDIIGYLGGAQHRFESQLKYTETSPEEAEIIQSLLEKLQEAIWESKSGLPKSWRRTVPKLLAECGVPFDEQRVWAEAQLSSLERLQPLDQYIASLDARRDALFREIERRRETIARRLRLMSDAVIGAPAGGKGSLTLVDSSTGSAEK
jgi:hypothetical protein